MTPNEEKTRSVEGDILITGGTGSFGNAMVEFLLSEIGDPQKERPRVIIYSRDEVKQARMRDRFKDNRHLRFFIGDVREEKRLRRAMEGVYTVIHAAALKRIETAHYNPTELVKTNIIGAMNVIEAAHDAGVRQIVALSSDKAFRPVSAYGFTKAMMECLMLAANSAQGAHGPLIVVTRYGNIAGSTGSVIPTWRALIAQGLPIRISDPDATRFWMTREQAVDLVLRTMRTMRGGELVIPEALPAFRLGDLAEAMGASYTVTYGLRDYEKLHEGMREGLTSDTARRMTVEELREALRDV